MVHISDPHLDFQYVEGALADCGSYLCCRAESGPIPTDSSKAAGKWGSYKCDLPQRTFENLMTFVRDDIKPDAVVWTGDNSAHDTW